MNITSKLPNVGTTIFTVMSRMANEYGAINLSQGFPDFEADPQLIELVCEQLRAGNNQYAPMPGLMSLRERISDKTKLLYNKRYDPESEITVTAGATQAIFTALASVIRPGDEVILFDPAYDCYGPTVELLGGKPVHLQLKAPMYRPDWQEVRQHIRPSTRMLVINSPHNPTGTTLEEADLLSLQQLVVENDLLVLSDEVYEHIIFDGESHRSVALFAELADRSFITASFGKTFHTTGWKMGYCIAPRPLMEEFRKVHQFNVFSVNHPIQAALANYLAREETYLGLSTFFQQKRDHFLRAISGSRFRFTPSAGTYFQLLDYSEISDENDIEYAERLVREFGLATIPTSVFNETGDDAKLLRVCFAKRNETLDKAAEIINRI